MKRKQFLSSLMATAGVMALGFEDVSAHPAAREKRKHLALQVPPYLKKGDIIGITSPAGFITTEDIQPAVNKISEWGFVAKAGNTIGKKDFTFGGTDVERWQDMQSMLDDRSIKAILCARGGYGTVRIIDKLDFKKFAAHPKWLLGFSDITVMHNHIHSNYNIASIHSKMCNSFPTEWNSAELIKKDSIESIRQCLTGEKMNYHTTFNINNKEGSGTGQLIGGNLKTIESLAGSKSDLITNNKILFIEDTGEYLYSIDRMLWNLQRTGKLSGLKGLIIGGFKWKKDDPGEEFGKTLEEIVLEKIKDFHYPVCFDFPVGHQVNNYAIKCGMLHQLMVSEKNTELKEI